MNKPFLPGVVKGKRSRNDVIWGDTHGQEESRDNDLTEAPQLVPGIRFRSDENLHLLIHLPGILFS